MCTSIHSLKKLSIENNNLLNTNSLFFQNDKQEVINLDEVNFIENDDNFSFEDNKFIELNFENLKKDILIILLKWEIRKLKRKT